MSIDFCRFAAADLLGKSVEFAPGLHLPSPIFHLEAQLFDEFGNLLGTLLLPFVLDLSPLGLAVVSVTSINQLWRRKVGRPQYVSRGCTRGSIRGVCSKGKLILVRVKAIDGFSIVVRVWIVLNGKAQSALVLHEIGSEFNGRVKQVKGR